MQVDGALLDGLVEEGLEAAVAELFGEEAQIDQQLSLIRVEVSLRLFQGLPLGPDELPDARSQLLFLDFVLGQGQAGVFEFLQFLLHLLQK